MEKTGKLVHPSKGISYPTCLKALLHIQVTGNVGNKLQVINKFCLGFSGQIGNKWCWHVMIILLF